MSNNQEYSKELVNNTATQRMLWTSVYGPVRDGLPQRPLTADQTVKDVNTLEHVIDIISKDHTQDVEDVCRLNAVASQTNQFTIKRTKSVTRLRGSETSSDMSEVNVKIFLTGHALISRTKSLYHFSKRQFNT
jgi:hypothetical protein